MYGNVPLTKLRKYIIKNKQFINPSDEDIQEELNIILNTSSNPFPGILTILKSSANLSMVSFERIYNALKNIQPENIATVYCYRNRDAFTKDAYDFITYKMATILTFDNLKNFLEENKDAEAIVFKKLINRYSSSDVCIKIFNYTGTNDKDVIDEMFYSLSKAPTRFSYESEIRNIIEESSYVPTYFLENVLSMNFENNSILKEIILTISEDFSLEKNTINLLLDRARNFSSNIYFPVISNVVSNNKNLDTEIINRIFINVENTQYEDLILAKLAIKNNSLPEKISNKIFSKLRENKFSDKISLEILGKMPVSELSNENYRDLLRILLNKNKMLCLNRMFLIAKNEKNLSNEKINVLLKNSKSMQNKECEFLNFILENNDLDDNLSCALLKTIRDSKNIDKHLKSNLFLKIFSKNKNLLSENANQIIDNILLHNTNNEIKTFSKFTSQIINKQESKEESSKSVSFNIQ